MFTQLRAGKSSSRQPKLNRSTVATHDANATQQGEVECFLNILHCNIRGFRTNSPKLFATMKNADSWPTLILLNETFLPPEYKPTIPGYNLIAARNRREHGEAHDQGGGIAIFAQTNFAKFVSVVHESKHAERIWVGVQTLTSRLLVCCWYRRPDPGEVNSIYSLHSEFAALTADFNFVSIIGDFNVHEYNWLGHGTQTTLEGRKLWSFCRSHGLSQKVNGPTLEHSLIDLVLTNARTRSCIVGERISDHRCVRVTFDFTVQICE